MSGLRQSKAGSKGMYAGLSRIFRVVARNVCKREFLL